MTIIAHMKNVNKTKMLVIVANTKEDVWLQLCKDLHIGGRFHVCKVAFCSSILDTTSLFLHVSSSLSYCLFSGIKKKKKI